MQVEHVPSEQVELWTPSTAPARPDGVHFSDILKTILVKYKPKSYGKPLDPHKIITGLSFEMAIQEGFKVTLPDSFRPNPIFYKGIWYSPDHLGLDPLRVKEFKLTWYSAGKMFPTGIPMVQDAGGVWVPDYEAPWSEPDLTDEAFWPYLIQMKNYCYVLGTDQAELWVLFINGNYKPPRPWRPIVIRITFEEIEMREAYSMIRNQAQRLGWIEE